MYQSYALIITRILEKTDSKNSLAPLVSPKTPTHGVENSEMTQGTTANSTEHQMASSQILAGYDLHFSPAVTVRFERLLDRINLYALPEIQECLDERDGLVFLVRELSVLANAIADPNRISILLLSKNLLPLRS